MVKQGEYMNDFNLTDKEINHLGLEVLADKLGPSGHDAFLYLSIFITIENMMTTRRKDTNG